MAHPGEPEPVTVLYERFNEPVIPRERIERWVSSFPPEDRPGALTLLSKITFHGYAALLRECRTLHARIREHLESDGFDSRSFSDVDFSREFTCKSGDIISYLYRKANIIPSVDFRTFDSLIAETRECGGTPCNRALVILDDYIGTGSQFIFQFIARSPDDIRVVSRYRKIYLSSVVTHENALSKLRHLQQGECRQVLLIEESQFPVYDWQPEEESVLNSLCQVDWGRFRFVSVFLEHPLLSDGSCHVTSGERDLIRTFLSKYSGDLTLTTSFLFGHHVFFYGAPNSVPRVLYPLFSRVEDLSIYPTEQFLEIETGIREFTMDERDGQER